jgi:hypothetical protein
MNSTNTAFNFFIPKSEFDLHITSILFDTPAQGAVIDIYEASSTTSTTIVKQILKITLSSKGFFPIIFPFGGFIPIAEGAFLNAKTDTATVNMTIIAHYRLVHT